MFSAALPTFLVTLREGFEAALVVGIVLAAIARSEQPQLQRYAYGGIAAGIVGSICCGVGLEALIQGLQLAYPSEVAIIQPTLKAIIGIVAIALLSWMLLWMTQQSQHLKADVEAAVDATLQQNSAAGWGVFAIITTAVLREGIETVLFVATQFQEGSGSVFGAIAGLLTAALLGVLLFQWGVRINLRRFFQTMGILLLLIVGGLVIAVLKNIDMAAFAYVTAHPGSPLCWSAALSPQAPSCLLGRQIWDATAVLPDRQFPGVILKTLVGYRDRLYTLQLIGYVGFWLTIGRAYLQTLAPRTQPPASSPSAEPDASI